MKPIIDLSASLNSASLFSLDSSAKSGSYKINDDFFMNKNEFKSGDSADSSGFFNLLQAEANNLNIYKQQSNNQPQYESENKYKSDSKENIQNKPENKIRNTDTDNNDIKSDAKKLSNHNHIIEKAPAGKSNKLSENIFIHNNDKTNLKAAAKINKDSGKNDVKSEFRQESINIDLIPKKNLNQKTEFINTESVKKESVNESDAKFKKAAVQMASTLEKESSSANKPDLIVKAHENNKKGDLDASTRIASSKPEEIQLSDKKNLSVKDEHSKVIKNKNLTPKDNFVSRETQHNENYIAVDNKVKTNEIKPGDTNIKYSGNEKVSLNEGMKKSMDSDMSSFQGSENQSNSAGEKLNYFNKLNNNPELRANVQRQVDIILSRARSIVRNNGNASLSTNLYPKELGKISIKLSLIDGKLHGQFTVDNETIQRELIQKMDKVINDMKMDGFDVEQFNVNVSSDQTERRFLENKDRNPFNQFFNNERPVNRDAIYNTIEKQTEGLYA